LANLKPPLAVLCDFDDTTAVENVAEIIMTRFGDERWLSMRTEFRTGRYTLREYQEKAFSLVEASRDDMMAEVQERATLRPGFKELHSYSCEHSVALAIVSNGLDFYVQALLEREGLGGLPIHTVQARFNSHGIEFAYPYADEACSDFGNCKCRVLEEYRKQGRSIVYVGDGRTDFCAAAASDLVFARKDLARFCRTYGIPHLGFGDFGDVLKLVRNVTEEAHRD
jgi:2,3-diketo-5-methylthio-1-phosphopentane phosphatase